MVLLLVAVTGLALMYVATSAVLCSARGQVSKANFRLIFCSRNIRVVEDGFHSEPMVNLGQSIELSQKERFRYPSPIILFAGRARCTSSWLYHRSLEGFFEHTVFAYPYEFVCTYIMGRRFPKISVVKRPYDLPDRRGNLAKLWSEYAIIRQPDIRTLLLPELRTGVSVSSFSGSSTATSGFDSSLRLVSSRNLFPPLADSHVAIENHGKESQPFHKQPYPVASLCAVVFGLALGFCAFWLMHESNHFYFGLFLLLISTCIFVYGLNGIFDVMEINTQRRESFPRLSQEPFGEVDELASNVIHLYQVSSPAVIGPLMNFIVFRTVGRSPGAEVHRAKDGAIGVPGNVLISENTVDDQHAIESSDTLNILRVHWTPRDERCEVYGPLGRIPV